MRWKASAVNQPPMANDKTPMEWIAGIGNFNDPVDFTRSLYIIQIEFNLTD